MPAFSDKPPVAALLLLLIAMCNSAIAAESDPDGRLFAPSDDAMADVSLALQRAADNERLGLVVLGANWCHDSRALAARLGKEPLADIIRKHYEVVFVDVGYLEKGRSVVQHFGIPQYYATPTLLIVDPASGEVVNARDRHQWGNAYNINMDESVRYFEKWPNAGNGPQRNHQSTELRAVNAEIDALEIQLAERVAGGYAVVGPLLEAYKSGNTPDNFETRWNELRKFRTAIPVDLDRLRQQAREQVSAGSQSMQLDWPEYPALSWETE